MALCTKYEHKSGSRISETTRKLFSSQGHANIQEKTHQHGSLSSTLTTTTTPPASVRLSVSFTAAQPLDVAPTFRTTTNLANETNSTTTPLMPNETLSVPSTPTKAPTTSSFPGTPINFSVSTKEKDPEEIGIDDLREIVKVSA